MSTQDVFRQWRQEKDPSQSWGLAWFLANEICQRFYASHGIVPWVINKEGLGYYGITLHMLPCKVHGKLPLFTDAIGRFTMGGNVENWQSGTPGDHGLDTIRMCEAGETTDAMVSATIQHLRLTASPSKSHIHCRHKRWGASYSLCFELAALLALKYEDRVSVQNNPIMIEHAIREVDPKYDMTEYPGAFVFEAGSSIVMLRGDGQLLGTHSGSLWHDYMAGASVESLTQTLIEKLDLPLSCPTL